MELRDGFAILARDDRSFCFHKVVEMLVEDLERSWTGMVETSLPIELANTPIDVDLEVFPRGCEGLKRLKAPVEGTRIDQIHLRFHVFEMLS